MAKKPLCPQECQDKHNETNITMTKILGKLDNIENKLEENTQWQRDIIEKFDRLDELKADKKQVDDLYTKYWIAIAGLVSLLITIIILLITNIN